MAPHVDIGDLHESLAIFLPRWTYRVATGTPAPDIEVTVSDSAFHISAVSWPGGESIAEDPNNAANALAGLLIDALLAHGMAACCLHAAGIVMDDSAVVFAGASEAGKSTLALRLAARGYRHMADDRLLLASDAPPYHVAALGLAAKARRPLPPGPELAALVAERQRLSDDEITYLHLADDEAVGFGETFPLGAVVLPNRDPALDVAAQIVPASAGEIAKVLIAEATSPAGAAAIVPTLSRFADDCRGYILRFRDGAAASELLLSELGGTFT